MEVQNRHSSDRLPTIYRYSRLPDSEAHLVIDTFYLSCAAHARCGGAEFINVVARRDLQDGHGAVRIPSRRDPCGLPSSRVTSTTCACGESNALCGLCVNFFSLGARSVQRAAPTLQLRYHITTQYWLWITYRRSHPKSWLQFTYCWDGRWNGGGQPEAAASSVFRRCIMGMS